ncbi:MAG: sigma-70 family RNA polymerase sigma factor [Actinobacteria bacterium]|nr:sigma-70 family RNA polymerase sigma factor [Actinomycetota bacterium]
MSATHDELLEALHDAHGPALFRFVAHLTHDTNFAEDVVQEALLRAWKRPEILEQDDAAARAWLFTVARNLVIDDRRSARYRREIVTEVLPDGARQDETNSALDAWIISDALSTLSLQHRKAVIAAYYLGQSITEIAREQDVPEGTIKSRLHFALRALRLSLQEKGAMQ